MENPQGGDFVSFTALAPKPTAGSKHLSNELIKPFDECRMSEFCGGTLRREG
jgi:hypothetical protein